MMWEDINKRKFPRAKYKCLIRVLGESKTKPVEAVTENISSGGLCVVLDVNLGLFQKVSLEVLLGTEKRAVSCAGVVVWVVKRHPMVKSEQPKYDTGIEFSNMPEEDRRSISNLVKHIDETGRSFS